MKSQIYPSDQTDGQWEHIKDLIPAAKSGGRPRTLDMRLTLNAMLYVLIGGIQWRMLPREYPNWKSVYHYFSSWRKDGTWRRIHETLRSQVRRAAGKHKHPTAGCPQRAVWIRKALKALISRENEALTMVKKSKAASVMS